MSNDPGYQRDYYRKNRDRCLAKASAWAKANPERVNAHQRARHARYKQQVLTAYGNRCECCGETNPIFLNVDHVNGDGTEHRRRCGNQTNVLHDIIKSGFPPDYRLLCFNCNLGREQNNGVCPHEGCEKLLEPLVS